MNKLSTIPTWAFELASSGHRHRAIDAHQNGTLQIIWPDSKQIKIWAKQQGWRVPWFNFNKYFINKMLESDLNFAQVLQKSGLQVSIPVTHYKISTHILQEWDALYEEREDMGVLGMRPVGWGHLVECLREVRRAIEAGVIVEVEDIRLDKGFLTWVHKRYHALEDGYDSWVGDDKS